MTQSRRQPPIAPQLTYVDQPEISETFVDSLGRMMFDGMNVRMEFLVNRLDDPKPPAAPTGRSLTACRIVIPMPGLLDLVNKLGRMVSTLQAQGGPIRTITNPPTAGRPH
jgi:hypothetical protein